MPGSEDTRTYETMPQTQDEKRLSDMKILNQKAEEQLAKENRDREAKLIERIKKASENG